MIRADIHAEHDELAPNPSPVLYRSLHRGGGDKMLLATKLLHYTVTRLNEEAPKRVVPHPPSLIGGRLRTQHGVSPAPRKLALYVTTLKRAHHEMLTSGRWKPRAPVGTNTPPPLPPLAAALSVGLCERKYFYSKLQ